MASEQDDSGTHHGIKIESTQVYRGYVEPENPEYLTSDGDGGPHAILEGSKSFSLDFHDEIKLTFECECGQRFRKPETARDHLEEVSNAE